MVTLNFYIAINFTNFCTKYGDIARAYLPAGEDPEDIIIKPKETDSQTIEVQTLEHRINTWMEAKEYVGSQFYKVFASHEGMSPTVWRREVMSK